jgi:hypothetical protein
VPVRALSIGTIEFVNDSVVCLGVAVSTNQQSE